jgi:hypothetical protein
LSSGNDNKIDYPLFNIIFKELKSSSIAQTYQYNWGGLVIFGTEAESLNGIHKGATIS